MKFLDLFKTVDELVKDQATFKSISFLFSDGIMDIDVFDTTCDESVFICTFVPHGSEEMTSFIAKGKEELKDQIKYFIEKR